ncbi:MAG: dihydroorotase [Gammaproteobacteria bacterium]|nr:dihydroorotase [Gammaproteobacteria bacterium]MCY4357406.1 dihydroorotase [Gammaproteobacteria bacterium]
MSTNRISLIKPDDWHLHLRDGEALRTSVPHTARCFARAIVMPNLLPPVTTVASALAYRERILAAVLPKQTFTPLMTLYLTDELAPLEMERLAKSPHVIAVKYYPAGATTNSQNGVTDIEKVIPTLERMAELSIPLLIHGEVTDPDTDIFDRERLFIEQVLSPLRDRLPELRVILEHITTQDSVDYVKSGGDGLAATITVHHLLHNRNDLLAGGIRPHFYCLPILKRSSHQTALIEAAISGSPKFFLGTDSAPHLRSQKESACGCAGVYTAPAALELYAEVFEQHNALDRLEKFASVFGPQFYGLQPNTEQVTLIRQDWQLPESYPFTAEDTVVPLRSGDKICWQLK